MNDSGMDDGINVMMKIFIIGQRSSAIISWTQFADAAVEKKLVIYKIFFYFIKCERFAKKQIFVEKKI